MRCLFTLEILNILLAQKDTDFPLLSRRIEEDQSNVTVFLYMFSNQITLTAVLILS